MEQLLYILNRSVLLAWPKTSKIWFIYLRHDAIHSGKSRNKLTYHPFKSLLKKNQPWTDMTQSYSSKCIQVNDCTVIIHLHSQEIESNIAKQVLLFLVVGINSNVQSAIGYFGTTTAKGGTLYRLLWDAIQYLELTCSLKVTWSVLNDYIHCIRAEQLITTIAETNMTPVVIWHARSTMTNAREVACGDENCKENCSVH